MRGCIIRRGPKSWAIVVYLGRDPQTGKERRKWYSHPTRREAEAHLSSLLTQIHGGGTVPTSKQRVGDYLNQWLRDYAEVKNLAPATRRNYGDILRSHLIPALGHMPLQRLSAQGIESYLADKRRKGLSSTTIQYHFGLLHEALSHAVRKGLLVRNPCDLVDRPRREPVEIQTLDEEQVRLFLAEAKRGSTHYRLYLAALLTGMRQGELLGLRWRDLDLTLGFASVQQTFYRLGKQQLFKEPKSVKSRRAVALPPALIEELRSLRREQSETRQLFGKGYVDHDLVFCQPNGNPLHGHNITKRDLPRVLALKGLRKELTDKGVPEDALPKGLPRIRFHDLRHCHATHLLRQGVHPKVVQERLGHSTAAFTLQVYSHVLPGMQEEAARVLETRLLGKTEQVT
ncbi:MAG: tyrosine-type recombinase/integrase [bacterium]